MLTKLVTIAGASALAVGISTSASPQTAKQESTAGRPNDSADSARTDVRTNDGSIGLTGKWNPLVTQLEVNKKSAHRTAGEPEAWDPSWQMDPRIARYQRPR